MHVDNDKLGLSPIIKNKNTYHTVENNVSDDSSTFLPDYGHLCDPVFPDNIKLTSNNISEIRDSVLTSPHIYGKKYRI